MQVERHRATGSAWLAFECTAGAEAEALGAVHLLHFGGGRQHAARGANSREVAEGVRAGGQMIAEVEYAIGTHAIRSQSGSALLGEIIDAWIFGRGLHEIDEHDARIRAVTAEQMQELANRYFVESALVQAVIRGTGRRV